MLNFQKIVEQVLIDVTTSVKGLNEQNTSNFATNLLDALTNKEGDIAKLQDFLNKIPIQNNKINLSEIQSPVYVDFLNNAVLRTNDGFFSLPNKINLFPVFDFILFWAEQISKTPNLDGKQYIDIITKNVFRDKSFVYLEQDTDIFVNKFLTYNNPQNLKFIIVNYAPVSNFLQNHYESILRVYGNKYKKQLSESLANEFINHEVQNNSTILTVVSKACNASENATNTDGIILDIFKTPEQYINKQKRTPFKKTNTLNNLYAYIHAVREFYSKTNSNIEEITKKPFKEVHDRALNNDPLAEAIVDFIKQIIMDIKEVENMSKWLKFWKGTAKVINKTAGVATALGEL